MWSNGICTDQKRGGGGAMCGAMAYVLIRKGGGGYLWSNGICTDQKKRGGGLCVEQ